MAQTIIPAGYRLTVTSWENDADNHQKTVHEGISKERVEYILEMCRMFRSCNSTPKKGFGNMYEPDDDEREVVAAAIRAVMEKHRAVLTLTEIEVLDSPVDPDEYADEGFSDVVCAFLEYSEDYAYRVYDKATVEYIPHEIRMEDVTKEFNTK